MCRNNRLATRGDEFLGDVLIVTPPIVLDTRFLVLDLDAIRTIQRLALSQLVVNG